jgi:hypothetical protein
MTDAEYLREVIKVIPPAPFVVEVSTHIKRLEAIARKLESPPTVIQPNKNFWVPDDYA